ncbi:MAG: maltose alpha-D-glucosyltransferase [Micrococcales bacterium]|nr:maltose alpha-D-glucosyltransferase [Micrococcales bacterium]
MAIVEPVAVADDPDWYRTGVLYQVHVRSFADGNGDGIGDFQGLTSRLDYIQELGATAIWLLPFYPSPLRDGGYDISDYTSIHPDYGTMRDFRHFIRQAHRRGIRVITEVVINHTSDQHEWFQRSRRAKPGSKWRDFYVWSQTNQKYPDARVIFSDFESSNWTWDPEAQAYFWHRFYNHQPDLNYDNPAVHDAVLKIVDFWLEAGVDGLRLDAVPYLYEREDTNCENLPETHEFLKKLRTHVDNNFSNRMLLAEANQWPEDTRNYFGEGDECHMAFNFPVMPRMYMAVQMEDRFPLVDIIEQTPDIPKGAQWALFLRNHDELTLEMVTDEERDYMYRVYATDQRARINLGIRRRLAPLLNNDRERIELLNGLLMSLPGTPIVYYGDEIAMGDNIYLGDRDGVRTPMQWSGDRNAGFSNANPQQLFLPVNIDPEYRYESVNVASQERNPNSLLLWMRRLIRLRQRYPVFGSGNIEFLEPTNSRVLCFLRSDDEETILVVANLSRFAQYVELDLHEYEGSTLIELFGNSEFPDIGTLPYLLTLGPRAFYWFRLAPRQPGNETDTDVLPTASSRANWDELFENRRSLPVLEAVLPEVLPDRSWFHSGGRRIVETRIVESFAIPLGGDRLPARMLFVEVSYGQGEPDTYVLPVTFLGPDDADEFLHDHPGAGLIRLYPAGDSGLDGVICDGMAEERFTSVLLEQIINRRKMRGGGGEIRSLTTRQLKPLLDDIPADEHQQWLWPTLLRGNQAHSTVRYGDRLILKFYRKSEPGVRPDWELGRYFTERKNFQATPITAAAMELRDGAGPRTLAVLHQLVPNEGTGWNYFLHQLGGYFERMPAADVKRMGSAPMPRLLHAAQPPELAEELFGAMLQNAEALAESTAEMHLALAADRDNPEMRPEGFTSHYQRSLYQSIRNRLHRSLELLTRRQNELDDRNGILAATLLSAEAKLDEQLERLKNLEIDGLRMRIHGDFHLGQVLFDGRGFSIVDFDGLETQSLSVRRFKRSPLRDVASMLRSLDYAALFAAEEYCDRFNVQRKRETVFRSARYWSAVVGGQYLREYLRRTRDELLVEEPAQVEILLQGFLIEKASFELEHELVNRPSWVAIPVRGLLALADN